MSELDDALNRTNTLNFEELKSELDHAKKEISADKSKSRLTVSAVDKSEVLLVSQHKDVNPMETESSNGSLMDMSVGRNQHFDISPLQDQDGENISQVEQTVSAKLVTEQIKKVEAPSNLLSLDVLRKQRDSTREQGRILSEEIMQEEMHLQQELSKLNHQEKDYENKLRVGQQELEKRASASKKSQQVIEAEVTAVRDDMQAMLHDTSMDQS